MELLDVVDENNNLIGIKEDKNIIHEKGLLHREIAVIIQNENGEYLVQKRSSNKKGAPNMWSFTTGHVELGEDYETTAIREIKEETKLKESKKLEATNSKEEKKTVKRSRKKKGE